MSWGKEDRNAYAAKKLRRWCAEVLGRPAADLVVRPRRVRHASGQSVYTLNVNVKGEAPHVLSFEVPFAREEKAPTFISVAEWDAAVNGWRTIIDLRQPPEPEAPAQPPGTGLSDKKAVIILTAALVICILSGLGVATRTASMLEGFSAYFWETADGVRGEGWYSFSFTPRGATGPVKSFKYDAMMKNRGGREFAVQTLDYARLSAFDRKPLRVYVNPLDPARSVLVPGIPPLAAAQLLGILAVFIPSLLLVRMMAGRLRGRPLPENPFAVVSLPAFFYIFSFLGAMIYMSSCAYVLRTLPPALPMAAWGIASAGLFLLPELARRLYARTVVRRTVYFILFFAFLPPAAILAGLALPYVLAAAALGITLIVLLKPFARANRTPLYAMLISLIWVPVYTAGLLAPCRAIIQLLHEALPYMPYNLGLTGIENPRVMAFLDVGVGLAGIFVCLIITYMDSLWRTKQAGLVDTLPTSKARSAAIGLVELTGTAVHAAEGGRGPVLSYDSRIQDRNRIAPFYLKDESGRILVDPRGAHFRTGWLTSLGGRIVEIVLKKRVQKPDLHHSHTMKLLPGDMVYVIGSARPRNDGERNAVGSERLVIGRRPGGIFNNPLWLAAQGQIRPGHDIEDVFFITDSVERAARTRIMKGMWQVWAWALLWIVTGLLMFHFQLPRTQAGYERWTMSEIVKYAAGTERLKAVLAYLDRQPRPLTSRVLETISDVPGLGPLLIEINYNQQLAQLSEGTNLLWRNKFPNTSLMETEFLLEALRSRSWDARWWAASRLENATGHSATVVPALTGVLASDDDPFIRAAAASSLGHFGRNALPAVPELVKAARSETPKLRRNALWTVARLPGISGGPAYDLFRELLKDEESERKRLGIQGLTNMGAHAAACADVLLSLTADESMYVRSLSLKAVHAVAPEHPAFEKALVAALKDPEDLVRREAVYLINEMKVFPVGAAAPLGKMITDTSASERVTYILSKMGPLAGPAAASLAEALGHKDRKIAYNAAFVLSRIGPAAAPALEALVAALGHKDAFVRRYSAQAIGGIGPDAAGAAGPLKELLGDPDRHVSGAARWALSRIQSDR